MVRKNFSRCIIAASTLYFKIPAASSLSYSTLESLDEMNNRCLICAIVLLLSTVKGLDVVIDIIVFQPPFVLFGGIFSAFFQ
jgi:hypothetical protein